MAAWPGRRPGDCQSIGEKPTSSESHNTKGYEKVKTTEPLDIETGEGFFDDEQEETVGHAGSREGQPVSLSATIIRHGFLRKVYGILTCQVLVTLGAIVGVCMSQTLTDFVRGNQLLLMSALFLPFGFLIMLHIFKDKYPVNMYLLAGFTLCEAYSLAAVCTTVPWATVAQALVSTAVVFIGLTVYTLQSKRDYSHLGAVLWSMLMVLITTGFIGLLFPSLVAGQTFQLLYGAAGALVFSLFIVFDTWRLTTIYGPDDYIVASIELYLDIVNLFLYILQILNSNNR